MSKIVKTHFLVWSVLILYILLVDPIHANLMGQIFGSIVFFLSYIFTFYISALFIIPRYWRYNHIAFFSCVLVLLILFFTIDYLSMRVIIPFFDPEYYLKSLDSRIIATNSLLLVFMIMIAAFSFHYNRVSVEKIKEQKEKEKSLLLKELNFLKSQFNSHITFNFLNFCYSHVHKSSKEVSEAIEIFSDMLRYTLRLPVEDKIEISNEISYIKNFIKLQELLTTRVFIISNFNVHSERVKIIPRILVTFVENAFKHGQFNNPERPIEIKLTTTSNSILFSVRNKKNENINGITSRIGLKNVKDILKIYYRNKHHLLIKESCDDFFCELQIVDH